MSAMHLRLSLPAHTDAPTAEIETRPSELERWLKGLPLLNVAESTRLLTRQLAGLNRTSIDDKLRLFPVLYGLWNFDNVGGRYEKAKSIAEELVALAEEAARFGAPLARFDVAGRSLA